MNKEIMATNSQDGPLHIYKILSLQNWQASQNRKYVEVPASDASFIHLSTEDQLEKIIAKYWSETQQFVILKIDANKLEGRLAYETNIGGATKYFHLYDGSIPSSAIVEAKIISA
jgi:uncharacterized protein (DUF952 family)